MGAETPKQFLSWRGRDSDSEPAADRGVLSSYRLIVATRADEVARLEGLIKKGKIQAGVRGVTGGEFRRFGGRGAARGVERYRIGVWCMMRVSPFGRRSRVR